MTTDDRTKQELANVYLHVGNSGTSFIVSDYWGPTVTVTSSSFGNLNQKFEFHTTREGLEAMRDAINTALQHSFSEPYCHAAEPPRRCDNGSTCCRIAGSNDH
jgi:hypothetical protein